VTLDRLEAGIRDRQPPLQPPAERCGWAPPGSREADWAPAAASAAVEADGLHGPGAASAPAPAPDLPIHYQHHDPARGIAFQVQRLGFDGLQVLDPRLVRIAPGACNERHRHAHESLFVVLEGRAEIHVGEAVLRLGPGGVAYVPRWLVHQSRNPCSERELLLLAITDFGLTGAVLGDYDRQTRLRFAGRDAFGGAEGQEAAGAAHPMGPTEPAPAARRRRGLRGLCSGLGRRLPAPLRRLWRSAWS
jgi:uncharacterized RmlC-like cupin family protein